MKSVYKNYSLIMNMLWIIYDHNKKNKTSKSKITWEKSCR